MEVKSDSPSTRLPKAISCVRCFKRKVKCDKRHPCEVCLRADVECIFRVPAPPRRRRVRSTDDALLARLKHYEGLLLENGIEPDPPSSATSSRAGPSPPPSRDASHSITSTMNITDPASARRMPLSAPPFRPSAYKPEGKLIVDQGRARFIENKLWTAVSEESRHNKDVIPESDSEDSMDCTADDNADFVLAVASSPNQTYVLHPSSDQIIKLWQIFLTNVNPLMKIVHQPTLQRSIESIADIERVPRGFEALLFAIYGAAVLSMRDGECQATFGEPRSILRSRYSLGVRRSLTRARFMASSDMMVLQALVIYLSTMRQDLDSRTLWTLTGVATRIAQGMGLHRDGPVLGLSPFETEMRRRLWWQIILLDFNATELSGFVALGENSWSAKLPSNINDVDIWPGMKEPPVERNGPTEMMAFLIRCEVCAFWKTKLVQWGASEQDLARSVRHWMETATMSEKDALFDELKSSMDDKFLKYCDQSDPLHMITSIMGHILLTCKAMQIKSRHPRPANDKDILDNDRRYAWTSNMSLIEADNKAHSYRSLQKFNWHTDVHFQWQALIYILGELIARPTGEDKDDAWTQIESVFQNHPNFISDHKRPLHIAIASMCLKAWDIRHKAQVENPQGSLWLETPPFIFKLQEQREVEEENLKAKRDERAQLNVQTQDGETRIVAQPQQIDASTMTNTNSKPLQPDNMFDSSMSLDFAMPMTDDMAMDWQTWDNLLNDYEMQSMPPSMNQVWF